MKLIRKSAYSSFADHRLSRLLRYATGIFLLIVPFSKISAQTSDSAFLARVSHLSMVTEKESALQSEYAGFSKLSYFLNSYPDAETPYYVIEAGHNLQPRFNVYFTFYCYPGSNQIKLFDPEQQALVLVEE